MGCGASQSVAAEVVEGHTVPKVYHTNSKPPGARGVVLAQCVDGKDHVDVSELKDVPNTGAEVANAVVSTSSSRGVAPSGGGSGEPRYVGVLHLPEHPQQSGNATANSQVLVTSFSASGSTQSDRRLHFGGVDGIPAGQVGGKILFPDAAHVESAPHSPQHGFANIVSIDEHALSLPEGAPFSGAVGVAGEPVPRMYQVNSFAASKSFRRQSYFGSQSNILAAQTMPSAAGGGGAGGGCASGGGLAPRIRTRSIAPVVQFRVGSRTSSFSSVLSDSVSRNQSMAFNPAAMTADIRSGRVAREDLLGANSVRCTYLASEHIPHKSYYVLKVLHNQFDLRVTPQDDQNNTKPEFCSTADPAAIAHRKLSSDSNGGDQNPLLVGLPQHYVTIPSVAMEGETAEHASPMEISTLSTRALDARVSLCMTLLQKMGHKNMQNIYSVLTTDLHTLFLGEFYFNTNIADVDASFDDNKACQLTKECVRALHYAHSHGIPHGHLTLNNLHGKDSGQGYAISDFGMAHLFQQLSLSELWALGYTSAAVHPPERVVDFVGQGDAKRRSVSRDSGISEDSKSPTSPEAIDWKAIDIWALGCCVYEARFHSSPFKCSTLDELHRSVLNDEPEYPPWSDINLVRLLSKMLNKDPAKRGPFTSVLREPFIRHRTDLNSRSQLGAPTFTPVGPSLSLSTRECVLELGTARLSPRHQHHHSSSGSNATSFPNDRHSSTPSSSVAPMYFLVDDYVHCSQCAAIAKVVCYQCTVCPDYRVCKSCHYLSAYDHDPSHYLQCHALDTTVPVETSHNDESGPNRAGRTSHRGTIMIATNQLTEREAMIFTMTGTLPMCLDVERNMMNVSVRGERSQFQLTHDAAHATTPNNNTSRGAGGGVGEGDDIQSPKKVTGNRTASSVAQKRGLMTEANAYEDDTVDTILDNNAQSASSELLLSNLDLLEFPIGILEPTPFAHVTVLDLANNKLCTLPDGIEYLVNLRRLLVGNNQLSYLPETLGNLTDLEHLDLNHNLLSELPQSLMFCDQMEILALDYNHFTEIPSILADLEVRNVYLAANPGIRSWPSRDVLESFPRGITIGLDNDPSLFAEHATVLAGLENHVHVMWNKIYPDFVMPCIFLGSLRSAQLAEVYSKLNIQYVLTMGRGLDAMPPPPPGKHKIVVVDDIPGASIDFAFEHAVAFMDEGITAGLGVLVHCFAGMSRSATTVIAYLMMRRGMRLDEAYCLTKRGRPAIYPNAGFFDQLVALDAKLFPEQRPLDMASMERDKVP